MKFENLINLHMLLFRILRGYSVLWYTHPIYHILIHFFYCYFFLFFTYSPVSSYIYTIIVFISPSLIFKKYNVPFWYFFVFKIYTMFNPSIYTLIIYNFLIVLFVLLFYIDPWLYMHIYKYIYIILLLFKIIIPMYIL